MQLKEIFDEFNARYYNRPIPFEDQISSDGTRDTYSLSFNPLCDYDPYKPQVYVDEVKLTEGVNYTIDGINGVLKFIDIPEPGDGNVKVLAFYQKCNMEEFINHYKTAVRLMQITFPSTKLVRIDNHKDFNVKEGETLTSIDLEAEPMKKIYKVLEIFQNKDDKYFVPFTSRGNLILLTDSHITKYADVHSDYGNRVGGEVGGVTLPFYVLGEMKFAEPNNGPEVLNTPVDFETHARSQILLLLGRLMYETWLHKSSPMAVTVLNIQNQMGLKILIQSLDLQLYSDLRSNFSKMVIPNTEKKKYE